MANAAPLPSEKGYPNLGATQYTTQAQPSTQPAQYANPASQYPQGQQAAYQYPTQYPPFQPTAEYQGQPQYAQQPMDYSGQGQYPPGMQKPGQYGQQYATPTGTTVMSTPSQGGANVYTPVVVTSRAKSLLGLLYTSLALSVLAFALSLVNLGVLSLFLTPVMGILTLIFTLTLVILTHKDFKKIRKGTFPEPRGLIAVCRVPTIVITFILVVPWIAATGLVGTVVSAFGTVSSYTSGFSSGFGSSSSSSRGRSGSSGFGSSTVNGALDQVVAVGAAECALAGVQIFIVLTIGIMSAVERTTVLKARSGLKPAV
ncbi:hypothetical protein FA15DRAFT_674816 [Coprinopsis marcescibilis]|uniref:Uncharacterized protein n=1 Tax=Coprinopsis marcescibilis TaxID=230819 RepID=A0A5C3KGQ5_COPMA|nr:hypothetical protein FA15DRAFT_674816 [Coprinopsis marcescibilis]